MKQTVVASVLAGALAGVLASVGTVSAMARWGAPPTPPRSTGAARGSIDVERLQLVDRAGKVRAMLAMAADGGPALFFFDTAGTTRLSVGLYGAGEREAPSVVLDDPRGAAAAIVRLFGDRDAPVVVLKANGADRAIFALDAPTMDASLTRIGPDGVRRRMDVAAP